MPEGTFEAQLPLIEVKRAMSEMSQKTILLADHSKSGLKSLSLSLPLERIDTIITDDKTPSDILESLSKLGKKVIVA